VTGLIYVAIVALWAAVLIPMWLRRHDDDQARRIERHRLAMGTLARIRGSEDLDARGLAARRRRIALVGMASVGALGSAAWLVGIAPGLVSFVLWLPFLTFLPVTFMAERASSRRAAERALATRREERRTRRRVPAAPVDVDRTHHAPVRRAPARPAWDDVFDQTA
jgi:hypothetical protein